MADPDTMPHSNVLARAVGSAGGGGEPDSPPSFLTRNSTWLIGLGAGVLNGLLGIGGGILIVPGLILIRGHSPRVAVSTSLGAVLLLSAITIGIHLAISGLFFALEGVGLLLICGAAASQLGSLLLNRLSARWILFLFAGLILVGAGNLVWQALGGLRGEAVLAVAPPLLSYAVIGAGAGLFSGLLGVGGGGLVVLAFALSYQVPILGGLPLALAVNIVNAGSGVLAQWRTGQIHWSEVTRLVPAGLLGIGSGVLVAVYSPAGVLRFLLACFFIYMSGALFRRAIRS